MARTNMKITVDVSGLNILCQVRCMAIDCAHNTAQRSHGTSFGCCDFKHICMNSCGSCGEYTPTGNEENNE